MSTPKAKNPPERIWLQVGDIETDCEFSECYASGGVTWEQEPVFNTDIEYRLVKRRKRRTRAEVIADAMKGVTVGKSAAPSNEVTK